MNRLLFSFIAILTLFQSHAQNPSTSDIRHAIGKGPFPIYANVLFTGTNQSRDFREVSKAFAMEHPEARQKKILRGFEINFGGVINEDDFLIRNFKVQRVSVEFGFRYLLRNLHNDVLKLRLQEEVASLRFGMRGNILYPITYQIQVGPIFYHKSSIFLDSLPVGGFVEGASIRSSVVDGDRRLFSGLDLRARLMIFDPAGTPGGFGIFVETSFLWNFFRRSPQPFYDMAKLGAAKSPGNWNYAALSIGVVVPLALRIQ